MFRKKRSDTESCQPVKLCIYAHSPSDYWRCSNELESSPFEKRKGNEIWEKHNNQLEKENKENATRTYAYMHQTHLIPGKGSWRRRKKSTVEPYQSTSANENNADENITL